ncbi:unnamed protein product [Symbiodinium sp. CCMP2592]|nr:unnamed protein product [Symbiodinium sp. CCMP2592]
MSSSELRDLRNLEAAFARLTIRLEEYPSQASAQSEAGPRLYVLAQDFSGNRYDPAEDIRDHLIVISGEVDFEYPLGVISVGSGPARKLVAAAAIGESSDGSVIVAFPGKCWNRTPAKRALGLDFVRKVTAARVRCAGAEDRSRSLDSELRVCLGLLTAEGEAAFDFVRDFEGEVQIDYSFGTSEQPELLPHAGSLAELAKVTFEFVTAESAAQEAAPSLAPAAIEDRLGRLEGCFQSIQDDLKKLVAGQKTEASLPLREKAKPVARAPPPKASGPKFEGLDPQVVKAALDSGIDSKHIEEMGRFLRSQGKGMTDEPRPNIRAKLARQTLEAEDDLDDEDPEDEDQPEEVEVKDPIHAAVTKLTAIAAQLAEGKKKETTLEALLDGSGSGEQASSSTSTRKSAAALRVLRDRLHSRPQELTKVIERNLNADFALRPSLPGSAQVPVSCRAWLESRSRVQNYPSTIRFLWIIAGIADAIRDQRYEEAYLRSLLGLAAGDQLSIDRGSWHVASEVLLEDPPPFPSFTSHTLPTGAEVPFTKLIDSRWIEIFVAPPRSRPLPGVPSETGLRSWRRAATGRRAWRSSGARREGRGPAWAKETSEGEGPGHGDGPERGEVISKSPTGKATHSASTELVRVPGSGATTVDPAALWKALPRLLLASDNSFSQFFSSYFYEARESPEYGRTASSPWPMPLPYFELCQEGKHSLAFEADARSEHALKAAANLLVASLSWLHLGRPREAPAHIRGGRVLDQEQLEHVNRLEEMMRDVICHAPVTAEDMGRVASKIENLEDIARTLRKKSEKLATLCRGYGQSGSAVRSADPVEMDFVGEARGEISGTTTAKPVVASRLEFGRPPKFDPAQFMDATSLDRYLHPLDHAVPEDDCPEPPPKARILATPSERIALFKKLDQSGRLKFIPVSAARKRCLNGLFSVPKSLTADRMILDARGPNLLEPGLNRWTQSLGCAEAVLQLRLAENEILVLSGADLKDYYYHYVISHQRLVRNALAGTVDEPMARTFSCFENHLSGKGPFRAALNSMAMGDLNSVEFGQLAHLSLSLQAEVFFPEEMLTLKSRAPRASIAGGVVIDDLFIAEKMDRSRACELGSGTSVGAARLKRAADAYVRGGLQQNLKKSFSEQLRAEVWGAEIDGEAGTCRPLTSRLIPVLSITVDIIRTKAASRHILASVAGFFVAIFQFRRRCMSLLEEIFKAPRWLDEHKAFRIWPALEAELWMLVLVAPAVRFNLRSRYCEEVSATDASDSWEAEVSQIFPEAFVAELSRHSLRKSTWTKLLRPAQAISRRAGVLDPSEELPGGVPFDNHPVWQALFRSVKFKEVWRRRIWRPRHINVHELRTLLASERRRGLASPASSIVSASDSQVSLGAALKGRSASPRLNGILRQSLPEHLSADISGIYAYVGTSDNPADDPTRHAPVRDAREALPLWLERALGGSYGELEDFLKAYELDTVSMLGLPPFEEIVPLATAPAAVPRPDRRRFFLESLGKDSLPTAAEDFASALLLRHDFGKEELLRLLRMLPNESPPRGVAEEGSGSFSGGMFVHGGVVGLRRNSRSYPQSEKAVMDFATRCFPGHKFTSYAFLQNLKTPLHRDSHNSAESTNLVIALTSFSGGELWVAAEDGGIYEEIDGKRVAGKNLGFQSGHVEFHPRQWHFTRDWTGDRAVLVLYSIRDYLKVALSDAIVLSGAGYHLPSELYKKFRSLKLPPHCISAAKGEELVAGKEYELEQVRVVGAEPQSGNVFELPPDIVSSLLQFDSEQFVLPKKGRKRLGEFLLQPGFLDLYSGSRGVAHELARISKTWVLTFDYSRSQSEDLLSEKLQGLLLRLIRGGAFLGVGGGPVCSSLSRAIRPPVRSLEYPAGLPDARPSMREKIDEGNQHADFMASVAELCQELDLPCWVENPHGSYLWALPRWRRFLGDDWRSVCWVVDYCALGAPWRKRTRFYVGRRHGGQSLLCPGGCRHQRLSGYSSLHRQQWTKVAEAYPREMNTFLAYHLANRTLQGTERRRLDLAACARCIGARIGEAKVPGPRKELIVGSLEEVSLVTPTTAKLQSRVLGEFEAWLLEEEGLSDSALRSLSSCAMAYCVFLRAYGDHLYRSGGPMYVFRHLLAYMQKNKLHLRPFLSLGWDLLSRWEHPACTAPSSDA